MKKIEIISSSVRDGRQSHRVALFLKKYIESRDGVETDILDLREYDFPLFRERFFKMAEPPAAAVDFRDRFMAADGIMIVTPVYNGSFPAALKNVIDLLYAEWRHKPVGIVSVTYSTSPGIATVQELQAMLMKMYARVASPMYTVISVSGDFSEDGTASDYAKASKYAAEPVDELLWLIDKTAEDGE